MDYSALFQQQIRIQQEAITLWKRWMVGLVLTGLIILIVAQLFPLGGPSSATIVSIGGAFVGVLGGTFPYKEITPKKERIATFTFLKERFRTFDALTPEERTSLMALAKEALEETIKR